MSVTRLMIVEGSDDAHTVKEILIHHGLKAEVERPSLLSDQVTNETILIRQMGGFRDLVRKLKDVIKESDLRYLGIIVDADNDVEAHWESVRNRLEQVGAVKPLPKRDPKGTRLETMQPEGTVIVGVWIMPDNQTSGALEHFCELLVKPEDSLWKRAKDSVNTIPVEDRRFGKDPIEEQNDFQKAYLHTWIAWQERPEATIGQSIKAQYLNPNAIHAHTFVAWVKRVFEV